MKNINRTFTLEEVEKLVKNAYNVGFCDGTDSIELNEKSYLNSDDFWKRNIKDWISKEINYVV